MKAKIILCKCPNSKDFYGIRIQEQENDWLRTWVFKISEDKAKKKVMKNLKLKDQL